MDKIIAATSPKRSAKAEGESSLMRMLTVIELFTLARPSWTVEQIAEAMGLTQSTAYRYVYTLSSFGYLSMMSGAEYCLGPKIIELDLLLRQTDPMIARAQDLAAELIELVPEGVVSLINLRGETAISVFQVKKPQDLDISFERGRSMRLYAGSASKVILAHLPRSRLLKFYANNHAEIAQFDLGQTWKEFSRALLAIRKSRSLVTVGELNPRSWGISAPVFNAEGDIRGSLNLIMPKDSHASSDVESLSQRLEEAARALSQGCSRLVTPPSTSRDLLGDPA